MAKHEVIIHENTGVTKESAPYLGSYVSKETIKSDAFAAKIAERCGLPSIQVQAILAGTFDEIERLQKESLVRVHLDGLMVCGIITGSFPTADAAFDSNRNALQLAVRLDEDVRNELADVTPTIVTDITVTKLRVDNVMDIAIPRPYNLIHGRHHFSVAGFKMVLGDEGAEVYLQNGHGATFPVVIDEIKSSQLFTAHTATLLEPGDYKLIVKSRGGDAEGPLQTVFRKVKYLAVEDPFTVEKVASEGEDAIVKGEAFAAIGTGLSFGAGDSVTVKWTEGGEEKSLELTPSETTPEKMEFDAVDAFDDIPDNTELTFEFDLGGRHVECETEIVGA